MGGWESNRDPKIDGDVPVDGLLGGNNSLAYKVHEIEKHFHGENFPFGNDGANNLEAHSLDPFIVTAGAGDAFGTELLIHDGTVLAGVVGIKADIGRVLIEQSNQNDANYILEFWHGTGAFGAAERLTGLYYRTSANSTEVLGASIPCPRITATDKIWARCKCSTDGKTLNFLLEIHGYVG